MTTDTPDAAPAAQKPTIVLIHGLWLTPLSYGGRAEHRPVLGTGRPPEPGDIARAVRLCRAVTASATVLAAAAAAA